MPRSCCTQLTSLSTDLRGGQGRGVSSVATLAPIGGTADQGKAGWRSSAEPIAGRVRRSSGTFDGDRVLFHRDCVVAHGAVVCNRPLETTSSETTKGELRHHVTSLDLMRLFIQ